MPSADPDALAAVHGADWAELDALLRRRRLDGADADRLVLLYQRTATHLSQVRSGAPGAADPAIAAKLWDTSATAVGR